MRVRSLILLMITLAGAVLTASFKTLAFNHKDATGNRSLLETSVEFPSNQSSSITIDFETAPGPDGILGTADDIPLTEDTVISDQFLSLGVIFSLSQGGQPFIATEGLPMVAFEGPSGAGDTPAVSGVNTLTDGSPSFDNASREADIAADFSEPVYGVSLVLIDFKNDCPSGNPKTTWLGAYDSQGNVLDIDTFTATGSEPQGNHETLSVTGPGIWHVALRRTTQDCGTAIDDFSFQTDPPSNVDTILWRIGQFDGSTDADSGSSEFLDGSTFHNVYVYDVNADPDDEVNTPNMPGCLHRAPCSPGATAERIDIHFVLQQRYQNLSLSLSRYGSESNNVLLDGTLVEQTVGPGENKNTVHEINLGPLSSGEHILSLEYAQGGIDQGNRIDALWLTAAVPTGPNAITGRITQFDDPQLGIADVKVSTNSGHVAYSDADGYYTIGALPSGSYSVTATLDDYLFSPNVQTNVAVPPDAANQNFTGAQVPDPFLDLPFNYDGQTARTAMLERTNSVFDHDVPIWDQPNERMLPYLGYILFSDAPSRFLCGPPSTECYDGHDGYDFDSESGDDILAAGSGTVTWGYDSLGRYSCNLQGRPTFQTRSCMATIDHGNGFETQYLHLLQEEGSSSDNPTCNEGSSTVNTGDVIGQVGMTGCTSGPHIHIELQFDGIPLDPSGWKDHVFGEDPWASHPNGNVSHHLWEFSVPEWDVWQMSGLEGGSMLASSGDTEIKVPAGAFDGTWEFSLADVPVAQSSATLRPTGHSFTIGATEAPSASTPDAISPAEASTVTLTKPLTITTHYIDTQIAGLDESTLNLYRWHGTNENWQPLTTTLNTDNNTAIANTNELGLFALLIADPDVEGPIIGQPIFDDAVLSTQALTVTVPISDSLTGGHGVANAILYYGYSAPFTQTAIVGQWPGGIGDGVWTFIIPPQESAEEGATLKFFIEAIDGDRSPAASVNDNESNYFSVEILKKNFRVFLPVTFGKP